MKVLIIGGTGNISTAITKTLLERGYDLTLFNRGKTNSTIARNCHVIIGDRHDHAAFESKIQDAGPFDTIIDMIAYVPEDVKSLLKVFSGKTEHLIFCSTVDTYIKPANFYPTVEQAERKQSPTFLYAYNKGICENLLLNRTDKKAFYLTIIRPAQTYNDSQTPLPLIGSGTALLKRLRQRKPIITLGDGTSLWVASHRDDVGLAFANAVGNPRTYNRSYTVSGDELLTWDQYFQIPAKVMNVPKPEIIHIPTDLLGKMLPKTALWSVENFHFNNVFDNSAAKEDLKYEYRINWEEGCQRMITWNDEHGKIDNSPVEPLYDRVIESWQKASQQLVDEFKDVD